MTLSLKRSASSGVRKTNARTSSSAFSSNKRVKSTKGQKSEKASHLQDIFEEELEDHGLVLALATDQRLRDVPQYVKYIRGNMFDSIPDRAGMNSTRITEVLNYQKNMPPITTRAHVHALSKSPTSTEREMAEMVRSGVLRRLEIPGRGTGGQAVGDCLVLTDDWIKQVHESSALSSDLKSRYIEALRKSHGVTTVEAQTFTQAEATVLTHAGFLTNPSALNASVMLRPDPTTIGSLALTSITLHTTSNSKAAVGDAGATHDAGGFGSALGNASNLASRSHSATMTFTIPSIGIFLRLLTAAREHLVQLLVRTRYRHAPLSVLRERWNGAVDSAEKQRSAGIGGTVLPSKTQKWKRFNGIRFQWVLEECLGTGLVEVFETGSVGLGVRLVS